MNIKFKQNIMKLIRGGNMPNKKYKEYSFSATQLIKSQAMVYIVATNIKEARKMLKKVKPHTIDWYPNNLDEQCKYNQVKFKLEGVEKV